MTKEQQAKLDERVRIGKEKEERVYGLVEGLDPDERAITFMQLLALGWNRDRAHTVKLKLGLTQ